MAAEGDVVGEAEGGDVAEEEVRAAGGEGGEDRALEDGGHAVAARGVRGAEIFVVGMGVGEGQAAGEGFLKRH